MKTLPRLLWIECLLTTGVVSAQETWYFQNPIPTASELYWVSFVDPQTGWVVGADNTFLRTSDGGTTWDHLQIRNVDWIIDQCLVDRETGWVIGATNSRLIGWGNTEFDQVLYKTTDGGLSWQMRDSLGSQICGSGNLSQIFFADETTGWLIIGSTSDRTDGRMLKTSDGGETWFPLGEVARQIGGLFFVDSVTGWGIRSLSYYQSEIVRTTDGGTTWIGCVVDVNGGLGSLFFIDSETGWVVGTDNYIYKTTNGGNAWFRQSISGNISNCQLTSVCFTDSLTGNIAGWHIFLRTTDGGDNWMIEEYQSRPSILSVCFANRDAGWRVGEHGSIEKTVDGGKTWIYQSKTSSSDEFVSVDFVDRYLGWVLSPSSIFHTSDGGSNWRRQYFSNNIPFTPRLNQLFFIDALNGWAVGADYASGWRAAILHTSDGGNHWEKQPTERWAELRAVCFIDQNVGWAVGDTGTILSTIDGGAHWNRKGGSTTEQLTAVNFVDPHHGWIGGEQEVLRTEDGGVQWHPCTYGQPTQSLHFVDSLNGWAVGGYSWPDAVPGNHVQKSAGITGYVFHSNDGGRTWEEQFRDRAIIRSVKFVNATVGWAVGSKVWHTEDGGKNWVQRNVPLWWANAVDFVDLNCGWLVGPVGTIMHTSDAGVTFVGEETPQRIPSGPLLHQNYPNPFNPSTTIRYGLPSRSHVTLTVFNTLGQQVATLVQGEQEAGYHEVRFDASGLSSGVYFYRLQAGDFVQTRRLLLLR